MMVLDHDGIEGVAGAAAAAVVDGGGDDGGPNDGGAVLVVAVLNYHRHSVGAVAWLLHTATDVVAVAAGRNGWRRTRKSVGEPTVASVAGGNCRNHR